MEGSVFVNTNILIYLYTIDEPQKQVVAKTILLKNNTIISTQVLQEMINITTKKLGYSYQVAENMLYEIMQCNYLYTNELATISKACSIAQRYAFSFYDSLIIAAALFSNCSILYSEDLQHKQQIDHKLTIINPFIELEQ